MEQYKLYPEMALFHIALREEMGDEEYHAFYRAEQESAAYKTPRVHHQQQRTGTRAVL